MERNELDPAASYPGKKLEPAFAPEWLKTATPATSDDHGAAKNTKPASFGDRNSISYRRSYTTNGSHKQDKDISAQSRSSSSVGWRSLENGTIDALDNVPIRSEKEILRRSQSMITGRGSNINPWTNNSIVKASFEREFPHLGGEDKHGPPEIRVSSPGVSSAVQSIPLYSSAIIGGDGWTSALAEMPVLSSLQARTPLKEVDETLRLEEVTTKMSRNLLAVTPASPKTSVNFAEKVKSKGSRAVDPSVKMGLQPQPFRGLNRSDTSKTPQIGNFQVLNREKNGISPPAVRDTSGMTSVAVVSSPTKSPLPVKVNGKPTTDKRPVSQQNRSDFFNSLRKKASESPLTSYPSTNLENSNDRTSRNASVSDQSQEKDDEAESCSPSSAEKSCLFDPAEEERFLRQLGWKDDAGDGEEGLTAEEIDAFIAEYEKRRPSSEVGQRSLLRAKAMLTKMGGGPSC